MLSVITGPMFSGKTQEIIRRIRRLEHAVPKKRIDVYKPTQDTRSDHVETHYGDKIVCKSLNAFFFYSGYEHGDWIFIDEFQFAPSGVIPHIMKLINHRSINVIVAGLSLDSRGRPFGAMAEILPFADEITILTAICKKCGKDATRTQRTIDGGETIMVGGSDLYEARCIECWEPK